MLQRETLKWLQSLDLQAKNPKRDFANGVLIAEIFSRYFPNQLNINLFYSGTGCEQKANNWNQLQKFFKRNDINIPEEAMDAVMKCQPDAAVLFIENIHMLLTNRRAIPVIHRPEKRALDTSIPHFAIPTAANMIRTSNVPASKADELLREYKVRFKETKEKSASKDALLGTGSVLAPGKTTPRRTQMSGKSSHHGTGGGPSGAVSRQHSAMIANICSIEIAQRAE
ncbi:spermatogenesis-associated protein 4 [Chytriomyces hyalinus]|nr:spermatogenesis-associated protein 4 [Chytriomyces hyalinus]